MIYTDNQLKQKIVQMIDDFEFVYSYGDEENRVVFKDKPLEIAIENAQGMTAFPEGYTITWEAGRWMDDDDFELVDDVKVTADTTDQSKATVKVMDAPIDEWVVIRATVSYEGNELCCEETGLEITQIEHTYDLPWEADRVLLGRMLNFGDVVTYYARDEEHPGGYSKDVALTEVSVLKQEPEGSAEKCVSVEKDTEGNWIVQTLAKGRAFLQFTYEDVDYPGDSTKAHTVGSSMSGEDSYCILVDDKVYYLDYEMPKEHQANMLPNSEMEVSTELYSEWLQENGDIVDRSIDQYELQVLNISDPDVVSVAVKDHTLVVKSKPKTNVVEVELAAVIDGEAVSVMTMYVYVCSEYGAAWGDEVTLTQGDTLYVTDIKINAKWYTVDHPEGVSKELKVRRFDSCTSGLTLSEDEQSVTVSEDLFDEIKDPQKGSVTIEAVEAEDADNEDNSWYFDAPVTILPRDTCDHKIRLIGAKVATCTETGYTGDEYCDICKQVLKRGDIIPAKGHGKTEIRGAKNATCTETGYTGDTYCTVCNQKTVTGEIIPKKGHGKTEIRGAKNATCTETGYTGDTYCTVCNQLTVKGKTIAAMGHTLTAWVTTTAPTVLADGVQTRTCTRCGHQESNAIAKLSATGTVSLQNFPLKVKQSYTLKVNNMAVGDYVVSWTSADAKIATVDKNGKVTGKKKGNTTIKATLASGLTLTATVKVQTGAVQTTAVTVNTKKVALSEKQSFQLVSAIAPLTSKDKVTYKTSNKKVATVSKSGKITAKKAGKATITVKAGKKSVKVTVTVTGVKTTAIRVNTAQLNLKVKKKATLKAYVTPGNSSEKVTYKSSNKKIATVDKKGKVTAKKAGTATITVTSGSQSVKVPVTVTK